MLEPSRRDVMAVAAGTVLAGVGTREAGAHDKAPGAAGPIVIGIPLFSGVTLLDFAGPLQIFFFAGLKVVLVAENDKPVACTEGISVVPNQTFENCPKLDALLVPGGGGIPEAIENTAYRKFLQAKGAEVKWVTSVCHGSLLLAAAGLLDGYEAITHWGWLDCLRMFDKVKVPTDYYARYHIDRNRITGGGISSGMDAALAMTVTFLGGKDGTTAAKRSQLANQYAPAPPFNDGLPHAADPDIFSAVQAGMAGLVKQTEDAIKKVIGKK
ncbi:MAG TPA: DJ-1/PfpI family protein [Gemmataceae bacterium]|jgi:cyclohexyl-isocyanide hydratase|nr:DJ-1/PfpI family protein [Gemmataceae bacterium]